jgi:hypothetical protein
MKLPVCSIAFVLFFIFKPVEVLAGSWYVSVNGLSTNTGSFTSPWSITHAFSRPSTIVLPGDTIFLRGGNYLGHFISNLNGTALAPIMVKNYPNERAILIGNAVTIVDDVVLTINGAFSQFMGLEITTNTFNRISTGSSDPPPDIYTSNGVYIYGQSVKLINCIIHNCPRGGIGYWSSSLNAEVYGCLIFNNGYTNASRGHGPGLYVQNTDETKPKSLINSFVFNGFSMGIQFYSSSNDFLRGFIIDSCTLFNAGANGAGNQSRRPNLLAGGASENIPARIRNLTITNNVFYRDTTDNSPVSFMPYSSNRKNVELGSEHTGLRDKFVNFSNNLLYGDPTPLLLHKWDSGVFRNNILYAYKNNFALNRQLLEQINNAAPFSNWDSNRYYTNQPTYTTPFSFKTFADWKTLYKVDSNSTFSSTNPVLNYYFVRKNRYEPHKYYVTVQNYTGQNSVELPLVNAALNNVSYAVFDIQYSLKTPVDTGTFNGVSIPLNINLAAVAPITGTSPVAPRHTSKTLGTFIIEFYPENTTVKNGNWADPTVWASGQLPQYFNKVKINNNVTVTANAWCKSVIVKSGLLTVQPDVLINIGQQ